MSWNKTKQQVYWSEKSERGVSFSLYSDGMVIVSGVGSQYGINIPAQLKPWIDLLHAEKGRGTIIAQLEFLHKEKWHCLSVPLTFYQRSKRWYFCLKDTVVDNDTSLVVLLKGRLKMQLIFMLPKDLWSTRYKQTIKYLSFYPLEDTTSKTVVVGEKKTGSYVVKKHCDGQFTITVSVSMNASGSVQFPVELATVFTDWGKERDYFLCRVTTAVGTERFCFVEATLQRKKNQPTKSRKVMHLPYFGKPARVQLECFKPELKLTKQGQEDFELKEFLRTSGFSIVSLKSNVFPLNNHDDIAFEQTVRSLFQKAFRSDSKRTVINEGRVSCNDVKSTQKVAHFIFDMVITSDFEKCLDAPQILLCEIKSSVKNSKNKVINDCLANFSYFKQLLETKNVIPIIILNDNFNRRYKEFVRAFSYQSGVLIIDNALLNEYVIAPQKLFDSILDFQLKQKELTNKPQAVIHPFTYEVVSKVKLQAEALNLLLSDIEEHLLGVKTIRNYCRLMQIRKTDFEKLFNEIESELYTKDPLSLLEESHSDQPSLEEICVIVHTHLCNKKFLHPLERFSDDFISLSNERLSKHTSFPVEHLSDDIKVIGMRNCNHQGASFEKAVKQRMELQDYTVYSNILFLIYGRVNEIDLLGLNNDDFLLVSCKDMSETTSISRINIDIRRAAKLLAYQRKIINATSGKLFVKLHQQMISPKNHLKYNNAIIDGITIELVT